MNELEWKEIPEDNKYANKEVNLAPSDAILKFTHQKKTNPNILRVDIYDREYRCVMEVNVKIMELDKKGFFNHMLVLFQQCKKETNG